MHKYRRVVFVLGAGASVPYGFPVGSKLRDQVVALKGNEKLKSLGLDHGEVAEFCHDLARSGAESVDQFLERRSGSLQVGKALIALALSQYENEEALSGAQSEGGRWYHYLFNRLAAGQTLDRLPQLSHISFVTFNYDRSLEHWLLAAVESGFGCDREAARKALKGLRVLHLHGTIGGSPLTDHLARPYGPVTTREDLEHCVASLRVVHENMPTSGEWGDAKKLLGSSSEVVFLGFGFNKQNLDRLELEQHCYNRSVSMGMAGTWFREHGYPDRAQILGTCHGMSAGEVNLQIIRPLNRMVSRNEFMNNRDRDVLGWLKDYVELLNPD